MIPTDGKQVKIVILFLFTTIYFLLVLDLVPLVHFGEINREPSPDSSDSVPGFRATSVCNRSVPSINISSRFFHIGLVSKDIPVEVDRDTGIASYPKFVSNDLEILRYLRRAYTNARVSLLDPSGYLSPVDQERDFSDVDVAVLLSEIDIGISDAMKALNPGAAIITLDLGGDPNTGVPDLFYDKIKVCTSYEKVEVDNGGDNRVASLVISPVIIEELVADALSTGWGNAKVKGPHRRRENIGVCIFGEPRGFVTRTIAENVAGILQSLSKSKYVAYELDVIALLVLDTNKGGSGSMAKLDSSIRTIAPNLTITVNGSTEKIPGVSHHGSGPKVPQFWRYRECYRQLVGFGKAHGRKYDWLVKLRPDLSGSHHDNRLDSLSKFKVHIRRYQSKSSIYDGLGASDHWAVVPSAAGHAFFEMPYDMNEDIYKKNPKFFSPKHNINIHGPEQILYSHMQENGWAFSNDLLDYYPAHWSNICDGPCG